jgi:hypothetical protein
LLDDGFSIRWSPGPRASGKLGYQLRVSPRPITHSLMHRARETQPSPYAIHSLRASTVTNMDTGGAAPPVMASPRPCDEAVVKCLKLPLGVGLLDRLQRASAVWIASQRRDAPRGTFHAESWRTASRAGRRTFWPTRPSTVDPENVSTPARATTRSGIQCS